MSVFKWKRRFVSVAVVEDDFFLIVFLLFSKLT